MYKLGDKIIDNCGNKAMFLSMLKNKGYNVPIGIIIDFEEFKYMIKEQKLNFETIDRIEIPDSILDKIFAIVPSNKRYAIRSSANIEDGRNFSLAGRYITFLNVEFNRQCLKDRIKECFLSLYSEENLQFYRKNKIDINKVEMNVIVQEMIESNVSGILFTVNPTNGKDTEVVIEFSKGYGDVVNGKTIPERIVYDWRLEKYIEEPKINILGDIAIKRIINISLTLQQELGFPIDVEFGVYDSKLYIFQVRPITKIENKDVYYRFTNCNLENIGVLSTIMTSLNIPLYTNTTISFIKALKVINESDILKPILFNKFSRLHWNLTLLKKVLENIPGYIERYLDDYIGVRIDYLDNGIQNLNTSKGFFKSLAKKNIIDNLKRQLINVEEYRKNKTEEIKNITQIENNIERMKKAFEIFLDIKSVYIWQCFTNIIYKINLNKDLSNVLNKTEFRNLFLAVDDKYKNGPYLHMWDSSRKIRKDKQKMKFFEENLDAEIFYLYRKDRNNPNIKEFLTDFIDLFGYHSFTETDIIYKTYDEEILKVIKMYRDMLELDDKYDPLKEFKRQNKLYEQSIEKLNENLKKNQIKNIMKNIEFVRELIKKENSLKDLVLFSQNLLRKELLKLGQNYKSKFYLENEEDIFYLDYKDILNSMIDNNLDTLKQRVNKNKMYYNSFRNYTPQSEIFPCQKQIIQVDCNKKFKGIGASFGKTKARACIVDSKEDLKNLKKSDILVTKYIDQEIFKKINIMELSGIVTEFGGMLCHLAINARENRIPCVVGLKDATQVIKTGEEIMINGDTGEVII